MTHGVRLTWFAFAVIEAAPEFISRATSQAVARTPKVSRARLISNVAQHASNFSILDFPECLPAKLEVVTLLIDRVAAIPVDKNSPLDSADQIIHRGIPG